MKVMFYINAIDCGGAERVITNLASDFAQNGNEVILTTSFLRNAEYDFGDKVKRSSLCQTYYLKGALKRNFLFLVKLRELLKNEKPDLMISFMGEPSFRAVIACIGLKTKNIVSIRNDPNVEYPGKLRRFLAKVLYRKADGIVFQTEDAKKWFPESIQNKSCIIFNPVAEKFFNKKINSEKHDIIAVGRLVDQKNHELLIRAFFAIKDITNENLIIYGEGNLRNRLQKLIEELHMEKRVFLPGIVDNVEEVIKDARLFVLSSNYEGMPNALMEAMAMGLTCISTDCPCGGPKMIIENGKDGVLVPVGDLTALANNMRQLLLNSQYADSLGNTAARKAEELFYPDRIFEQWRCYANKIAFGK